MLRVDSMSFSWPLISVCVFSCPLRPCFLYHGHGRGTIGTKTAEREHREGRRRAGRGSPHQQGEHRGDAGRPQTHKTLACFFVKTVKGE